MDTFIQSVYVHLAAHPLIRDTLPCSPLLSTSNPPFELSLYIPGRLVSAWKVNAHFFASSRQGFGRTNTKSHSNLKAAAVNGVPNTSSPPPKMPHAPSSSSISVSSSGMEITSSGETENKRFFNEKYAKCSVKGNFLTLAAQPKNVELGEWLAHQCEIFLRRQLHIEVLTNASGRNEQTSHWHDTSDPGGGHQYRLPLM